MLDLATLGIDLPEDEDLTGFQFVLKQFENGIPEEYQPRRRMLEFIENDLGERLWSKQREMVDAIDDHRYVSIASGHGIGKSFTMALVVLAFIHTHPNSTVLTTAPTGHQVEEILWQYIRAAVQRHRKVLTGRPLNLSYTIAPGWRAIGFKPADNEPDRLQGFHAPNILTIIDEAAGVTDSMIDVLHATMTGENARFVLVGNPTSIAGRFRESHHQDRDLYHTISISVMESPNFTGELVDESISGLPSPQFVQEEIKKHGIDSDFIQARVFAQWPKGATETLIALSALEAAQKRGLDEVAWMDSGYQAGFDAARFGDDRSVLTIMQGQRLIGQVAWTKQDTDYSIGRIQHELEDYGGGHCDIKVDEGGVGGGILDGLVHQGWNATGVQFGGASSDKEQWPILRHELYWIGKEAFDMGEIAGEFSEELISELTDIRYTYDRRHTKPIIEDKAAFKKRRGFSPDLAESLFIALYQPPAPALYGTTSVAANAQRNIHRRRRRG